MKSTIKILGFIILTFVGCNKDVFNPALSESIESLSLWWNWSAFNEGGRGMNLTFSGIKALNESYMLKFTYTITGRDIIVSLTDKVDNGKCINIETGMVSSICQPSGTVFIPDSLISVGTYNLNLRTPDFETNCELLVGSDSIVLNIPPDQHFSSLIHAVYPLPANLLFCYIVGEGDASKQNATTFLNDLLTLGITRIMIPDYPYNDVSVDKEGDIPGSSWPPDHYSIGSIYTMHNNFKDIITWTKNNFISADFNIYLYTSNGAQASLK
jgi:hypothetical protein